MAEDISLDQSYDGYPRIEEAFQIRLDESLEPRGPASLVELVAELDLPADDEPTVVDVGCGEGDDAIALAQRLGLAVIGVDPVARHVELAAEAAAAAGLGDRAHFRQGRAEDLPVEDDTAALLWCKEVLMYADLPRAFGEFRRVLRDDGYGMVYQVLTGPRMTDAEAEEFWGGELGPPAVSIRPADMEQAIAAAGLVLRERVDFGSEWGEWGQERHGAGGRRLVHAARLLRRPDRYIAEFGEAFYQVMLGDCLWHVYRMIGKLHGAAFVFSRPG